MRQLVRDLRAPRYAALTVLMVFVAAVCVAAGTWQIARYDGKHLANDDLRRNAAAPTAAAADVLPVAGSGAFPPVDDVEYRTVTATGTYLAADQVLVRRQQQDGVNGFWVLTPLRGATDTLLVVRGFLPTPRDGSAPVAPAAPGGTVTVTGRVEPAYDASGAARAGGEAYGLTDGVAQVQLVDVAGFAARLGAPVYAGYVSLDAGQPGGSGLVTVAAPDLSNPAGGAFELQHLAYVVQWYLFAGLALAAPVVMVRTDRRRGKFGGAPAEPAPVPVDVAPERRLADRYGRG